MYGTVQKSQSNYELFILNYTWCTRERKSQRIASAVILSWIHLRRLTFVVAVLELEELEIMGNGDSVLASVSTTVLRCETFFKLRRT